MSSIEAAACKIQGNNGNNNAANYVAILRKKATDALISSVEKGVAEKKGGLFLALGSQAAYKMKPTSETCDLACEALTRYFLKSKNLGYLIKAFEYFEKSVVPVIDESIKIERSTCTPKEFARLASLAQEISAHYTKYSKIFSPDIIKEIDEGDVSNGFVKFDYKDSRKMILSEAGAATMAKNAQENAEWYQQLSERNDDILVESNSRSMGEKYDDGRTHSEPEIDLPATDSNAGEQSESEKSADFINISDTDLGNIMPEGGQSMQTEVENREFFDKIDVKLAENKEAVNGNDIFRNYGSKSSDGNGLSLKYLSDTASRLLSELFNSHDSDMDSAQKYFEKFQKTQSLRHLKNSISHLRAELESGPSAQDGVESLRQRIYNYVNDNFVGTECHRVLAPDGTIKHSLYSGIMKTTKPTRWSLKVAETNLLIAELNDEKVEAATNLGLLYYADYATGSISSKTKSLDCYMKALHIAGENHSNGSKINKLRVLLGLDTMTLSEESQSKETQLTIFDPKKQNDTVKDFGDRVYTVIPGDMLFEITQRFYGDKVSWQEIAKINNLDIQTGMIHPGNQLKLPKM